MSRVSQPRRAQPIAYRAIDPVAALGLGVIVLGIGAILSGIDEIQNWQFQFDGAYLASLVVGFLQVASGQVALAAGPHFDALLGSAYSSLIESAPMLIAALLLALFAIGPAEIAATLSPGRIEHRG